MIKTVVSFIVAGDLVDSAELSRLTGVAAAPARERRHPRPLSFEDWTVQAGPLISGVDGGAAGGIGGLVRELVGLLEGPADLIREYCAAHALDPVFEVWIQSSDGTLPGMVVAPEFSTLASRLGADIGFDLYTWLGPAWRPEG
jgi:hypothetical protein